MTNLSPKRPLLIAHRGDTAAYSENTLEAFQFAFDKGADGVELDIHLHQGEVIIVHNYLFDTAKSYPKLKDVLSKIANKGRIEIEIKEFSPAILEPLKKVLAHFPTADFELTTSETPLAPYIKETFPKIKLGLIFPEYLFRDWMTDTVVANKLIGWGSMSKADILHLPFNILAQFGQGKLVEALHDAGFRVHSHIFNTTEEKHQLALLSQWKVDQCTFDSIGLVDVSTLSSHLN